MPYERSVNRSSPLTSAYVSQDRIITVFPQPFHRDASPYSTISFSPTVKDACAQNKTGTVGMKICKGVVVGDVAVGKTSLVNRFCHDVFDRDYKATIGVDFEVEKFSILNVPFNLQVWDTAGQERFKCIAASYYRGANVVIVVFDLSDIGSLSTTLKWKDDACESADDPLVFLVGTKKDLVSENSYLEMEMQAMRIAHEMGAEYWAVSSKSGENIKEFFFRVVAMTFNRAVLREVESLNNSVPKVIGNDLVRIDAKQENVYEKNGKKPKLKCCN